MMRQLLNAGAQTEVTKGPGVTPLLVAAGCGNLNCSRELLLYGADPHARSTRGESAWDKTANNSTLREMFETLGVTEGKGNTGKGRFLPDKLRRKAKELVRR